MTLQCRPPFSFHHGRTPCSSNRLGSRRTEAMRDSPQQKRTVNTWHAQRFAQAAIQTDDCCLHAAIANWTICNLFAGCRCKWTLTDSTKCDLVHNHPRSRFAFYCDAEQTTLNITSTDIKNIIRAAAFRLFNLDPKCKPSWTPNVVKPFVSSTRLYHTVRDGFPRNGNKTFTALEIQRLLHVYLRNLAVTSRQHNDAPSYASTILIFCIHAHNATKFEPV